MHQSPCGPTPSRISLQAAATARTLSWVLNTLSVMGDPPVGPIPASGRTARYPASITARARSFRLPAPAPRPAGGEVAGVSPAAPRPAPPPRPPPPTSPVVG